MTRLVNQLLREALSKLELLGANGKPRPAPPAAEAGDPATGPGTEGGDIPF